MDIDEFLDDDLCTTEVAINFNECLGRGRPIMRRLCDLELPKAFFHEMELMRAQKQNDDFSRFVIEPRSQDSSELENSLFGSEQMSDSSELEISKFRCNERMSDKSEVSALSCYETTNQVTTARALQILDGEVSFGKKRSSNSGSQISETKDVCRNRVVKTKHGSNENEFYKSNKRQAMNYFSGDEEFRTRNNETYPTDQNKPALGRGQRLFENALKGVTDDYLKRCNAVSSASVAQSARTFPSVRSQEIFEDPPMEPAFQGRFLGYPSLNSQSNFVLKNDDHFPTLKSTVDSKNNLEEDNAPVRKPISMAAIAAKLKR